LLGEDKGKSAFDSALFPPSGKNYFIDIYLGLLELAEPLCYGGQPDFDYFIENLGYLMANYYFLRGDYERRDFLFEKAMGIAKAKRFVDVKGERNEIFWTQNIGKSNRDRAVKEVMRKIKKTDIGYFQFLFDFGAAAMEYDNTEHILSRRTKRLLRNLMEHGGLDIYSASFESIDDYLNERKSACN
jgi:hypothetical protein